MFYQKERGLFAKFILSLSKNTFGAVKYRYAHDGCLRLIPISEGKKNTQSTVWGSIRDKFQLLGI